MKNARLSWLLGMASILILIIYIILAITVLPYSHPTIALIFYIAAWACAIAGLILAIVSKHKKRNIGLVVNIIVLALLAFSLVLVIPAPNPNQMPCETMDGVCLSSCTGTATPLPYPSLSCDKKQICCIPLKSLDT